MSRYASDRNWLLVKVIGQRWLTVVNKLKLIAPSQSVHDTTEFNLAKVFQVSDTYENTLYVLIYRYCHLRRTLYLSAQIVAIAGSRRGLLQLPTTTCLTLAASTPVPIEVTTAICVTRQQSSHRHQSQHLAANMHLMLTGQVPRWALALDLIPGLDQVGRPVSLGLAPL